MKLAKFIGCHIAIYIILVIIVAVFFHNPRIGLFATPLIWTATPFYLYVWNNGDALLKNIPEYLAFPARFPFAILGIGGGLAALTSIIIVIVCLFGAIPMELGKIL